MSRMGDQLKIKRDAKIWQMGECVCVCVCDCVFVLYIENVCDMHLIRLGVGTMGDQLKIKRDAKIWQRVSVCVCVCMCV